MRTLPDMTTVVSQNMTSVATDQTVRVVNYTENVKISNEIPVLIWYQWCLHLNAGGPNIKQLDI